MVMPPTITYAKDGSAVREGVIMMGGGFVAHETFPGDDLAEVAADILRHRAAEALQYGADEGYLPLRQLIADWLVAEKVQATADEIMIVSGTKQTIDLVGRALCPPGSAILYNEPTYVNGIKILRTAGFKSMAVPGDEGGMDVDAVERLLRGGARPTMIYCIPDIQNPDGATMSAERREKLVDVAARYNIPILEDNPYRWTRFEGEPVVPLKHFDRKGIVISTGTFSKILAPGLRVAWVHARKEILEKVIELKSEGGTSPLPQMMAYELYKKPGKLEHHLQASRAMLRTQRDATLQGLAEHFGSQASWNTPCGGNYVWVRFPDGNDTDAWAPKAKAAGFAYFSGSRFFAREDPPRNYLRLAFCYETPERICIGIGLLANVVKQQREDKDAGRGPTNRVAVA